MCWAAGCLLWFMLLIFMTQKAEYLLPDKRMSGIRLFRSSVRMLDIGVLSFLIWRNSLTFTLIFQRKSSHTNGRNSLGAGWLNVPSLGSIIPDASVNIMRFHLFCWGYGQNFSFPYFAQTLMNTDSKCSILLPSFIGLVKRSCCNQMGHIVLSVLSPKAHQNKNAQSPYWDFLQILTGTTC